MTSLISASVLSNMFEMAVASPPGAIVELGVYRGGSAYVLAAVAERHGSELHLFDTFCGMPVSGEFDQHKIGDFADTSLEEVRELVPSAIFHVGVFPDTMPEAMPPIGFLHIDCDQYETYLAAIDRFSPLMARDGVMWFDDVGCLASADKAVREHFTPDRLLKARCGKYYVRF